jgi:alpha-ketoglutarate-dependent taurine dioxygenase
MILRELAQQSETGQALGCAAGSAPLGKEVLGLDISQELDEVTFAQLRDAYDQHSVLVFRNQRLSPEQHIRFSKGFGELEIHVVAKYLLPGHPEFFAFPTSWKMVNASAEAVNSGTPTSPTSPSQVAAHCFIRLKSQFAMALF